MEPLDALGPLDGRYRKDLEELAQYFSERALIGYRAIVEAEYLIAFSELNGTGLQEITLQEQTRIRNAAALARTEADIVKLIETKGYDFSPSGVNRKILATNHDVQSVVEYMKARLTTEGGTDYTPWIHFGLTSEDVTNLAYGLMLSNGIDKAVIPTAKKIHESLVALAHEYADTPMLARTHGQSASPTTTGKEFAVYAERMRRQLDTLIHARVQAKLNCATGNYNALHAAYPNIDWLKFSEQFINRLAAMHGTRLEPTPLTTQIEPHDSLAELFDATRRLNTILVDFNQDMWRYISDNWIVQRKVEGEVGSSTMPHKVNPINFENSEGNLLYANALFEFLSRKLPVSRLQRDLTDSTVLRNVGAAYGHSLLGYKALAKGLAKIRINTDYITATLDQHPEVLAEPIQIILRREGIPDAYNMLKELTRGRDMTMDDIGTFISGLDVSDRIKDELRALTPRTYTGLAATLAQQAHAI